MNRLFTTVATLFAIVAAIYGGIAGIDSRVKSTLQDEEVLRELASRLRPTVIFNDKGSIIADLGAMTYIHSISVSGGKRPHYPERIVVSPKLHLDHAPILSTNEPVLIDIDVERGEMFDWIYTIQYGSEIVDEETHFRLEIIR